MLKIEPVNDVDCPGNEAYGIDGYRMFSPLRYKDLGHFGKATRLLKVKRKEPVYLPGDPANKIYLVHSGRVKTSRVTEDGKEITISIYSQGDMFGELEVLEGGCRETMAEALEDICLSVIGRDDFEELLWKEPTLMFQLIKLLVRRLKRMERRVEDIAFRDVPTRLARVLLRFSTEFGIQDEIGLRINRRVTHLELANLIGSTRETVTATLNDFRRKGLIQLENHFIIIRD
jgi:CRP-like cAMP-binding protein